MQLEALNRIGRKIFGSKNDRELKRLQPLVKLIGDFEPTLEAESDDQLQMFAPGGGQAYQYGGKIHRIKYVIGV